MANNISSEEIIQGLIELIGDRLPPGLRPYTIASGIGLGIYTGHNKSNPVRRFASIIYDGTEFHFRITAHTIGESETWSVYNYDANFNQHLDHWIQEIHTLAKELSKQISE